jgi:hypothetical protein
VANISKICSFLQLKERSSYATAILPSPLQSPAPGTRLQTPTFITLDNLGISAGCEYWMEEIQGQQNMWFFEVRCWFLITSWDNSNIIALGTIQWMGIPLSETSKFGEELHSTKLPTPSC